MKKRYAFYIFLCVILAVGGLALTGCTKEAASVGVIGAGDSGSGGEPSGTESSIQEYTVSLYFANEEYIDTGDESAEKFKIKAVKIFSNPENVYLDTLELLRSPEQGGATMVNDQIRFNKVYREGDTFYVDLDGSELYGGSSSEVFLVSQIINTLLSFDEGTQVQFMVDGEIAETLMGHVGTAEPFSKDLFE